MREVKVVTEKHEYAAGELVEGQVVITSDDEFKYNAIHLTFTGRERTEFVVGGGDDSHTCREKRVYFEMREDFDGEGVMAAGETRYPFRFRLPDDAPSSYSGTNGWSEYLLKAVVEVSWAVDPREEVTIGVHQRAKTPAGHPQSQSIDRDGRSALDVEVERDSVCLGEPIRLRFRVARDVKIRGVRVTLLAKEHAVAEREDADTTKTLVGQFTDGRELGRDVLMNTELQTNESMPASFNGQILNLETYVKITLDVPWARDTWTIIPVVLIRCVDASMSEIDDYFNSEWKSM